MDTNEIVTKPSKKKLVTNRYPKKKHKGNKWSEEVFAFIKKNLNLSNAELTEKVNKKFKIGTTEGSLGVQIAKHGIKRDKKTFSESRKGKGIKSNKKKEIEMEVIKGNDHNKIKFTEKEKVLPRMHYEADGHFACNGTMKNQMRMTKKKGDVTCENCIREIEELYRDDLEEEDIEFVGDE